MTDYNPKADLFRGADIVINFTIYAADGYTAENITTWTMEANFAPVTSRNTAEDLAATNGAGIAYTDAALGKGTITILAAKSQNMTGTDWEWDLWRTDAGSTYPVALGSFTLGETPRSRSNER